MKNEWFDIYNIRQTLLEMLLDRNYPSNQTTIPLSFEAFKETFPNALTDRNSIKISVVKELEPLVIHFFDELKVGLKSLKTVLESFERQNVKNIILVCKEGLSPACKKIIEANPNIEVFYEKDLKFNVTKHELVPKHRILQEEEKGQLLKNLRIQESQLPWIYTYDPVIKYLGGKRGEVVEILRKSETAGESLYYRLIV